ncbi:MAG: hypothetical protein QG656_1535 [Candidatus Hydrogenedentes bacterium]|nr:hypothetical protein [Candidatus Hydrogenedentota bacterium]
MATEFHHYGVPTAAKSANEVYIAGGGVYATDPEAHPFRVEFLRFDADSPLPKVVQDHPHAAFVVDDLDAAVTGMNVIIPPFDATDVFRCAFVQDGDAVIELMQRR